MKNIGSDRWMKIEQLMDQALELDPSKRVAFVREQAESRPRAGRERRGISFPGNQNAGR